MKSVLNASDCSGEGTATMRKRYSQSWETLKYTAKNHGANGERCFGGHSDQPRHPQLRHAFLAHHVPGMNKNRGVQILSSFPNNIEGRMVEVTTIRTMAMIVRIDV